MKRYAQSPYQLQEAAFTRQHYEAVAAILKKESQGATTREEKDTIHRIASALADIFARDNSRFDRGFFMNKCE